MSSETHIFMKTCHFNVSTLSIAFVIYNSKSVMDICQLTKTCHVQTKRNFIAKHFWICFKRNFIAKHLWICFKKISLQNICEFVSKEISLQSVCELRNNSTVFEELEVNNCIIIFLVEGIWKGHIFRHLFICFQISVYTLGEFHKNRNNSTVFEELSVSIVDLTGLRIHHLENMKSYMSYVQQYTKIIKMPTLKTYFS
jgi:hypothetical protein